MEVVIIGGIAAGMGVAAKAARENPQAKITVIEKEDYISFGACGLSYYLGNQFDDEAVMFARTVAQMEKTGIDIKIGHEATD
ncbi:NADH oxidase [Jeotgalibaca dankookensis]|uniref:NADH oxidase n=1 Tax=Jeotgalibaca dankookensis TaxID=708126 RepID=A0A1S6IR13_9LACT|nr:FAD-dependent oxidoreductase [Jeotgalibaca dankookensis]AQS53986.1 NADH oxidase [Jeotgalibaca dankookensis]